MNEITETTRPHAMLPLPDAGVSVRVATMEDLTFIDELQKKCREQLGFMFLQAIAGKIERGEILIAEDGSRSTSSGQAQPVGYCISVDRYSKHDDVGIIYQMNVVPTRQRQFIAAALLKAMFDRAAYGCKLFCCWCAQDLPANRFWEAMGFVPLAYRAGSEKKSRVHIFWQKRIRAGDTTTPWWFPSKTDQGAMRADRIVLPIPPGKHWSDEMPVVSAVERPVIVPAEPAAGRQLPAANEKGKRAKDKVHEKSAGPVLRGPRQFAPVSAKPSPVEPVEPVVTEKPKREKKPKVKCDPKLVSAARELRDRWLEHVNAGEMLLEGAGKYDVSKTLPAMSSVESSAVEGTRALPAMPERPTLLLPAA
jgi:GNAT superfamily N-acetyltransferase